MNEKKLIDLFDKYYNKNIRYKETGEKEQCFKNIRSRKIKKEKIKPRIETWQVN